MEEKADLRQEYREKGYVIRTVFTPQEVEKILNELLSICKGNRGYNCTLIFDGLTNPQQN